MKFLQNLQYKSHAWKKRFSLVVAGSITLIVFIIWLAVVFPKNIEQVSNGKQDTKEVVARINEPLKTFGYKLSEFVSSAKGIFANFSKTTSTTSSSTDLVQ